MAKRFLRLSIPVRSDELDEIQEHAAKMKMAPATWARSLLLRHVESQKRAPSAEAQQIRG